MMNILNLLQFAEWTADESFYMASADVEQAWDQLERRLEWNKILTEDGKIIRREEIVDGMNKLAMFLNDRHSLEVRKIVS